MRAWGQRGESKIKLPACCVDYEQRVYPACIALIQSCDAVPLHTGLLSSIASLISSKVIIEDVSFSRNQEAQNGSATSAIRGGTVAPRVPGMLSPFLG